MTQSTAEIRNIRSFYGSVIRVFDALCIFGGLFLAQRYGAASISFAHFLTAFLAAQLVHLVISEFTANYRNWRGARFSGELVCVWGTWAVTLGLLLLLTRIVDFDSGMTAWSFTIWSVMSTLLFGLTRAMIRHGQNWLRSRGFNVRSFAIVGINDLGIRLAQNIADSPRLGKTFAGFYDDRPDERTAEIPQEFGRRIGTIPDLLQATKNGNVDVIYLTFPMRAEDRLRQMLDKLTDTTASVYIVPDFFVFELLHSRWNDIQGIPVVSIFENPVHGVDGISKRALDLCLASLMLVFAAIPMLVIAALIKWTSPGPVFFKQKRYGLDGREILIWKFRTMNVMEEGSNVVQATQDDPRITKFGNILRQTSLDELPQLFNVLGGSMSLVGPRPHATIHNEHYRGQIHGYMLRHKIKPGMTGLAQVNGWRGETDQLFKMEKRVEFDHRYIREWSILLDLKILLRTLYVVLAGDNAY
jgi:putative colanic acid biosynthesis UDP-glucose lipid carrier transferase